MGDGMMLTTLAASFAGTMILVVVLMVSSTLAAALRQRRCEFALLRAIGATGGQVRSMITGEVLLVFAVAGPLGAVPGLLAAQRLTPLLVSSGVVPAGFELSISPLPVVATLALLIPTGLIAARLAGRDILRTSPTAAVRESSEEPSALGRGRRITAASLAVAGVMVALVPFAVPGTMGSAAGASSALLLITAGALGGPLLVAWTAEHALRRVQPWGWASGHLALANARGFSRRLSTAIVPLALLLAMGTVQTSFDKTAVEAGGAQLESGLHADLVVDTHDVPGDQLDELARMPGVADAAHSGITMAEVKVEKDDEDFAALDALSWEQTSLRVLAPGATTAVIDPKVTSGSLVDLDGLDTIAVGSEATFGTGKGLGDTIEIRYTDGVDVTESVATIVAVYDRALGFGPFVVGEGTLAAHGVPVTPDVLAIKAEPGATADVQARAAAMGLATQRVGDYVAQVTSSGGSEQSLSAVLLLALLAFIALAAANTLAMLTAQRGGELALLRRTGATGRQLTAMIAVESTFVVLVAWVLGTAAVLPALVGASFGLLGSPVPTVDWGMYAGLATAIAAIAVLTIVPVALRRGSGPALAS